MPLAEREYMRETSRGKHESASSFAIRKRRWGFWAAAGVVAVAWVAGMLGFVTFPALICFAVGIACVWPVWKADFHAIRKDQL